MPTLYTQQSRNVWKTWLIMSLFVLVIVGLGYALDIYYGDTSILYIAFIISIVMNVGGYWFSDKIALSMAGAREVKREDYLELFRVVENLAITAGLPMPRIYVINDPAPNAFATGRNKDHAAIAVTTGLLSTMNRVELEGVIAHELSHIGNRDILLQTVIVVLVGFVVIISDLFSRGMWRGGRRRSEGSAGGLLAILSIVFIVLSPVMAQLIQLAVSRKREFLADASGALLTRYPDGLASALEKIGAYSGSMEHASNATAHLYISNPFGAKSLGGISKLFMTHPPIEERVVALRGMPMENKSS
jgi:heat shock protein HtpX